MSDDSVWLLDGPRVGKTRAFTSRHKAELAALELLEPIWETPCVMQCGSTDGVEVTTTDAQTLYVWGDGYVARVMEAG